MELEEQTDRSDRTSEEPGCQEEEDTDDHQEEFAAACNGLHELPFILSALSKELKFGGYAGSTEVPELVFLCMYTRFLKGPVSLLIKGPSGSGKSFALDAGRKFVPKEAYELFHGMSEKSLLYMPGLNLQNRYLIVQEAAGNNKGDGRVFLRQLLSEGEVRYATVMNTAKGLVGKDLPPLKGPTGLIMTTTANVLHPEDESRMLSVQTDESPERTKAIIAAQAGIGKETDCEPDLSTWHALHKYVGSGSLDVEIPFAEALSEFLPLTHHRIARDFPKILSLIKAHALMHQFNRDTSENGAIIANMDDYAAVHRLIGSAIAEGLEAAVPDRIRQVVEAVDSLLKKHNIDVVKTSFDRQGISQRELAEHIGLNQSVISRNLKPAIYHGYLVNLTPGQGVEATIVLGARELPSGSVLPSPEELEKAMGKEHNKIKFKF